MSARRRRVLVDVGGSSAEGRRAVREMRDELRRLGREEVEARIDVNERVVLAKIQRVQERIERLKQQPASIDVDMKVAGAYAQLDRLNLRLDRLRTKRVNIDVDVRRGTLERTAAGLGTVDRAINSVVGGFSDALRSIPVFGRIAGAAVEGVVQATDALARGAGDAVGSISGLGQLAPVFGSLAASAAGVVLNLVGLAAAAGAAIIVVNALLGAIIALGSALVALLASLTAAAGGLAVLGVAFAAALGPAVIVAIGLIARFTAILKARQAREQELTTAVQAQKTAEQQRKDALEQSRQAHERLAQATVDGNRAMEQSVLDLRDAELGLASSRLGVEESRLSLKEAQKALRDFRKEQGQLSRGSLDGLFKRATDVSTDPSQIRGLVGQIKSAPGGKKVDSLELERRILAVRRAQLTYKESVNQTTHAEDTLAQAQAKRTDFVRHGIRAYAPYRQALEQVRRADERVARAQAQTSAAHRKYEQALKGLTTTERGTLARLDALIKGFTRLAKVFTDPIFRAMNSVFDSLRGKSGFLSDSLKAVGEAMGGAIRQFGAFLAEPGTQDAFRVMAAGAAALVRELGGRAFISFLRIMQTVATTALPTVVFYAGRLADLLARVAGNSRGVRSVTRSLIDHFQTWAGLGWQVLRAVAGIFRAAAGPGKALAGNLTTIVKRFADWANSKPGQEQLRAFFARMVERAKSIVHWLIQAVVWLRNHLPGAAQTAGDAFKTLAAAVKPIVDPLRTAYHLLQSMRDLARGDLKKAFSDLNPLDIVKKYNITNSPPAKLFKSFWGSVLGKAAGGLVPGHGRGDIVPAMLEPGEFVLKRSIVQQLSLPVLHALNGGSVPQLAGAAAAGGGGDTYHIHVPAPMDATKPIDAENAAALLQQALERRGGIR